MARYAINGIEYPGVTGVLGLLDKSMWKTKWALNCMESYIQKEIEKKDYYVDGSLSEITDIIYDAKTEYRNISDTALSIGSEVHNIIEQDIKAQIKGEYFGWRDKYRSEVENAYRAFLKWEKDHVIEYLESETPVYSARYCYAGTLDIICRVKNIEDVKDGSIFCIDLKTSKGFYDGMAKQISAYKYARTEFENTREMQLVFDNNGDVHEYTIKQHPIKIDGIGILRIDKLTGEPEFKNYTKDYDKKLNSFLKLLDFYYADKKRRLKNNLRVKEGI